MANTLGTVLYAFYDYHTNMNHSNWNSSCPNALSSSFLCSMDLGGLNYSSARMHYTYLLPQTERKLIILLRGESTKVYCKIGECDPRQ